MFLDDSLGEKFESFFHCKNVCIRILDILSYTPEANPISRLAYSDVKDWIDADEGTPVVEAFTDEQLIKCCKPRNAISIRKV
jgi:hypothetical protein